MEPLAPVTPAAMLLEIRSHLAEAAKPYNRSADKVLARHIDQAFALADALWRAQRGEAYFPAPAFTQAELDADAADVALMEAAFARTA